MSDRATENTAQEAMDMGNGALSGAVIAVAGAGGPAGRATLLRLAEAGATVIPACPAWYRSPTSLEDLADSVVARILQTLGVEHKMFGEWMKSEKG